MEFISYESATEFHNGGRQPYSQHVQIQGDCFVWNIHTLTKQAYEQIMVPMLDKNIQKIYLLKYGEYSGVGIKCGIEMGEMKIEMSSRNLECSCQKIPCTQML